MGIMVMAQDGMGLWVCLTILVLSVIMIRGFTAEAVGQDSYFMAASVEQDKKRRKPNARTLTKKWAAVVERRQLVAHQETIKAIKVDWREVTTGLRGMWKTLKDEKVAQKKRIMWRL